MSNPGNKRLQRARHGAAPSSSLAKKTVTTTVNGRTFTVTRQEGSVLNNAGNMKFGLFPTIGKSMPFLLKLVDCCDKGKDISFGVVTESHLEPEPEPVYTPLVNHVGKTRPEQMMITGNIYWAVNEWIEDPSQFKSGGAYEEYGPIEKWDTSQVTDMSYLIHPAGFYSDESAHPTITNEEEFVAWVLKHDKFNEDLSQWDVSSVTDMSNMFSRDWAGDNLHGRDIDVRVGDISGWDVSSVTNMSEMFGGLRYFNQDISGWDVSSVTNMSRMFYRATSFDQPLNGWDVSRVTDMTYMFSVAREFNQDLSGWDVSSVTNMSNMFNEATSFNQDLSGWDVSNVSDMTSMFNRATSFNQPLGGWNISNVTNMRSMFNNAKTFNQPLNGWDVSNVSDMTFMFYEATSFDQPLGGWNTSNVSVMSDMFRNATSFNQDLSGWDVSSVTYMYDMFNGATAIRKQYSSLLGTPVPADWSTYWS